MRERRASARRIRRRLRPATASDLDVTEALLMSIGAGDSSVAQVGKLAATLARRIGDRTLVQLACVRERDLHKWCARQPWHQSLPELYEFSMQKYTAARGPDRGTALAVGMHSCILPHELFARVAAYSAELWQLLFGSAAELKEWWHAAAERARSTAHGSPWCAAAAASCSGHCVPIGIHGDDAGGHGNEKVTVVTWGSVAVARSTLDSRLVFTMLKGSDAPAEAGLRSILRVLTWSLNALAEGRWPAADESGRLFDANHHPERAKLAGHPLVQPALAGFDRVDAAVCTDACPGAALPAAAGDAARVVKGIWSEMRGDWKFLKEALGLKRHYGVHGNICHRCRAHNGRGRGCLDDNLLYTNFGREDHVRTTLENPATWVAAAMAAPNPSPLLHIRGFSIDRVFFDIMHCMDLGVFQHAVASALSELTGAAGHGLQAASIFPGADLNARLAAATVHYRSWCRDRRLERRAPKFTQRWVKGPWPEVSQLQAKAAEMRTNLVPWLRDVCAAAAAEHGDHGHVRAAMFNAFVRIDEACRGSSRFLTAEAAEELELNMETALRLYNALAAEAADCGRALWRLRPKLHACTHVGFDHGGTNPRWVHCYADEDMVGRMKRLYKKCHGATAPSRGLQRYMIMVGLRWARLAAEAA